MNLTEMEIVLVKSKEIYPRIVVYSDVFKNIEKMYSVLKELGTKENELFKPWTPWYTFGNQIKKEDTMTAYDETVNFFIDKSSSIDLTNEIQSDQKWFMDELIMAFHSVNNDYLSRYQFSIDLNEKVYPLEVSNRPDLHTGFPSILNKYKWQGPSICRYYADVVPSEDNPDVEMQYHSDYIIEEFASPGYKFILTTTTYINDDYEGGEVVFINGDDYIVYKPKMGDVVVFPSGHPNYFTENNNPYYHAVKKVEKKEKYFTRMYWMAYEEGSKEYFENKKNFSKEERQVKHKEYSAKQYGLIQKQAQNLKEKLNELKK